MTIKANDSIINAAFTSRNQRKKMYEAILIGDKLEPWDSN